MELKLATDWDVALDAPRPGRLAVGHFVGREREVALIANELLRSPQRSIFVSGYRGVGKTVLINKVLTEVVARGGDRHFLYVILNGTQLEIPSAPAPVNPAEIMKGLIRRLYASTVNDKDLPASLQDEIARLYFKAVAKDYSTRWNNVERLLDQTLVTRFFKLELTARYAERLAGFAALGIAAALLAFNALGTSLAGRLGAVALAALAPLSVMISFSYSKSRRRERASLETAQTLYTFDASLGNLEFDLEQVHSLASDHSVTVVYVIDELDKIDAPSVVGLLRYFKKLFTLSDAAFIFVGGEELEVELIKTVDPEESVYRPSEYTYFSSQYFVPRPRWQDVDRYLMEIIDDAKRTDEDQQLLDRFKKLLIFEASNDFFDLRRCLRDRIGRFRRPPPCCECRRTQRRRRHPSCS